MAKCIIASGVLMRVSDHEAERLVAQGAKYVSKSVWKNARKQEKSNAQ